MRYLLILLCLFCSLAAFAQPEIVNKDPRAAFESAINDLRTKGQSWERSSAASRLAAMKNPEAIPVLVEVMLKDVPEVANSCAQALRSLGDRQVVPDLLKVLAKYPQNQSLVKTVTDALVFFGDPAMKGPLVDLLRRRDLPSSCRTLALVALETVKGPDVNAQILAVLADMPDRNDPLVFRAALAAGRRGMREAAPQIIPLLQANRPFHRLTAIQALGMLTDQAAIEPLTQLMNDKEPTLRLAALDALAVYRKPELQICFAMALQDREASIRAQGAAWIGEMGTEKMLPLLVKALADPDAGVRATAARAMRKYGPAAAAAITPLLADKAAEIRAAAAQALGSLGQPDSAPALVPLLSDAAPVVREAATAALGRLGAGAASAILPLVKSDQPALRAQAAAVLGRMTAEHALLTLTPLLNDPAPEVRLWAVYALGETPDPPVQALQRAMRDEDPAVSAEAMRIAGARKLFTLANPLLILLEQGAPAQKRAAYAALQLMAGEDLGPAPANWSAWVQQHRGE